MRYASRTTVSTLGVLAGLVGIEHGIGEIAQGNRVPDSMAIASWPDTKAFDALAGEPAMTIVPNLLTAGLATVAVAGALMAWSLVGASRPQAGWGLIGLSALLLLVGGGFGPPLLGLIAGLAALPGGRMFGWAVDRMPDDGRGLLGAAWPWLLGGAVTAWLLLMPGVVVAEATVGLPGAAAIVGGLTLGAFALTLLALVAAAARDAGACRHGPEVRHGPRLLRS
jgi:hypothetical protein